jgi:hypothetical protein
VARITTVICTSHSPFLVTPVELWEQTETLRRAKGGFAEGVPQETRPEKDVKRARVDRARITLRDHLRAVNPDVLVIFGDDQQEQFQPANFPALSIFTGLEFSGFKIGPKDGPPTSGNWPAHPRTPEHWATVPGSPDLAKALLRGLTERGFDMAFSTELADKDRGMGHAFMRPHTMLETNYTIPTVPIWINCYLGPQPTALRCYDLGRAVRDLIAEYPEDISIGIIGSGGLWHTPEAPRSCLDEEFDQTILAGVRTGKIRDMAVYFDSRRPEFNPDDVNSVKAASGGTGIISGLGSGTGETRNWIAACAMLEGHPGTVVDYIPIYASPIGAAFAYYTIIE